jgi:hypothetical protein
VSEPEVMKAQVSTLHLMGYPRAGIIASRGCATCNNLLKGFIQAEIESTAPY